MANPLTISSLYVPDRAQWRAWLQDHHQSEPDGIWLVYYKAHSGKPTLEYNESVEEALCFGWVDSLIRRIDEDRYVRKFTPRKSNSRWAESNRLRVTRLMDQGLMAPAGMACVEAAKTAGLWADSAPARIGQEMSSAFRTALERQHAARVFFDKLTAAQQRDYVVWINQAKREETRHKRVGEAIRLLEQGRKLGMK